MPDPVPGGAAGEGAAEGEGAALGAGEAAGGAGDIVWANPDDPSTWPPSPPAPNGSSSPAGDGQMLACPGNQPFAMGIDPFLDDFAEQHGATTWKQLDDPMNWQQGVLQNLMDPDTTVLFNLDGVDSWGGVQRAAAGMGGATDWELLQLYQNPDFPNVQYWRGGTQVQSPFIR